MKLIIKLFPEITIKSKPVRKQLTRQLAENLRSVVRRVDPNVKVVSAWDSLELDSELESRREEVIDTVRRVPGIANFIEVRAHEYSDMDDIFQKALPLYRDQLAGKTFVVRVKRAGNHPFKSTDVERYVGGGLNQHTEAKGVSLKNPDVVVKLEIRHDKLFLVENRFEGLGGFPLGSQDPVLSLISGGFDSTVSSFLTMKRGLRTHFCFFNLGGSAHEIGVKQVALYLWEQYGISHRVKFVTVPFEEVVGEILNKVHHSQMGVILKRMMVRAAEQVADELRIQAIVTGEAVAQVSSQTLTNLKVIDQVSEGLILRPLVTMDKQDIIRLAAEIGTEEFAKNMPEFCGVISDRPTTKAKLDRVVEEEGKFDFDVLTRAFEQRKTIFIDEVLQSSLTVAEVEVTATPAVDDVVIDVRHPHEEEKSPLMLTNNTILKIPFYELAGRFAELEPSKRYLLYCDQGTMSQLHASHLKGEGHQNVWVYKPE